MCNEAKTNVQCSVDSSHHYQLQQEDIKCLGRVLSLSFSLSVCLYLSLWLSFSAVVLCNKVLSVPIASQYEIAIMAIFYVAA
jgi:hypothetical protein